VCFLGALRSDAHCRRPLSPPFVSCRSSPVHGSASQHSKPVFSAQPLLLERRHESRISTLLLAPRDAPKPVSLTMRMAHGVPLGAGNHYTFSTLDPNACLTTRPEVGSAEFDASRLTEEVPRGIQLWALDRPSKNGSTAVRFIASGRMPCYNNRCHRCRSAQEPVWYGEALCVDQTITSVSVVAHYRYHRATSFRI
jgi:hypothetical protein